MHSIRKQYAKLQDFLTRANSLDDAFLLHITTYNTMVITAAALLTIIIELCMVIRLLISRPAVDTPASRTYLLFYLSLIAIAGLFLLLYPRFQGKVRKTYWLQFSFVACYLAWNVLLNTYDLHRDEHGSCLALISAILFASILIHFRPQHMMLLQSSSFLIFFFLNQHRIDDTINASIAVSVAVMVNFLFYTRNIQAVDRIQRITQMNAHLEKEQMDGAKQYLRRLQDAQTQTAIYRHDLRHTLTLIEQLAMQGNLEKLQSFVCASHENLQDLTPTFYCEHETANLILGSFAHRATTAQVAFKAEAQLPETLALSDTELCALLSNLLENALHGALQLEQPTQRNIYVKAVLREDNLVILVENSFAGDVRIEDGRPQPLYPTEHHGFGIQSIINITERHQGLYLFEASEQLFRAKILLRVN